MSGRSIGRNFWIFRLGQMGSSIGDQLALIAISFYVLSKLNLASQLSFIYIPSMLVGLIGMVLLGPFGDIFQRKGFIVYGNMIKAIVWICIVGLFIGNHLTASLLSFLYVLSGIGTAIIATGSSGFLPELVAKKDIQKAFQLITGSDAVINILGGAGAGVVVSFLGIPIALSLNTLSFILIALTACSIHPQFQTIKNESVVLGWKESFFEGIQFINRLKQLKIVLIVLFAIQLIIAPMEIAIPFFVKKYLHESSVFLGILLSAEGIGIVFSALTLRFFEKYFRNDQLMMWGIILSAFGIFMLGFYPNKIVALIFIAMNGAGITTASMVFNTSLLKIIPEMYRSRFFTILLFAEGLAAPMGLFFTGQAIDFFGITKTFMFMGGWLFCLMLCNIYLKTFRFLIKEEYNEFH